MSELEWLCSQQQYKWTPDLLTSRSGDGHFFNDSRGRVVLRAGTWSWKIVLELASPALQNIREHIIPQKDTFGLKQFEWILLCITDTQVIK